MFCVLLVVLIAAPNNRRRSFFFRFQEAESPTGGHPKIALDPLCLKEATLCLFSHINLVLSGFAHQKGDLGWSTFGCVHWSVVGEVAPPAPLGPGWKLKIQRLILRGTAWTDVHTKFGGLIRWGRTLEIFLKVSRFFCYVFTHCWLLPWRTKLKLTPCTKLADTKWKTSKPALKTDLQSWIYFQLAFLQLMYVRSVFKLTSERLLLFCADRWNIVKLYTTMQHVLANYTWKKKTSLG